MNIPAFVPLNGPPRTPLPNPQIFKAMGVNQIFNLLKDFYKELEISEIHHIFPGDMEKSSEKSAAFFVGLLGGPPLYHERYGNPMMRARHMPFPIDQESRNVWLKCFKKVLINAEEKYDFPSQYLDGFIDFLDGFSTWMINISPKQ